MKLVYFSVTGNTEKIAKKLKNWQFISIKDDLIINEPYVLITSTTGFGKVQKEVKKFLKNNANNLIGVIGSGNRNWGSNFCKGSKTIAEKFNVPYLYSVELAGTTHDIAACHTIIENLEKNYEN